MSLALLRALADGSSVLVAPAHVQRCLREGLRVIESRELQAPADALRWARALTDGRPITFDQAHRLAEWHRRNPVGTVVEGLDRGVSAAFRDLMGGSEAPGWLAEVLKVAEERGHTAEFSKLAVLETRVRDVRQDLAAMLTESTLTEEGADLPSIVKGLSAALDSAMKEIVAYHNKLGPHAKPTQPKGVEAMQARMVMNELVNLMKELRTTVTKELK